MANELTRTGYGQVEPNHLSAPRTGQIYAQLPWDDSATSVTVLENGTFAKYDMAAGKVNFTGAGEWMLVLNEVKLYNEQYQNYKDFALKTTEATDGVITPRLFKTNIGDIYTTNMVKTTDAGLKVVDVNLVVGTTGILEKEPATPVAGAMTWKVVKVTTMPDGQAAVKLQRIQ